MIDYRSGDVSEFNEFLKSLKKTKKPGYLTRFSRSGHSPRTAVILAVFVDKTIG